MLYCSLHRQRQENKKFSSLELNKKTACCISVSVNKKLFCKKDKAIQFLVFHTPIPEWQALQLEFDVFKLFSPNLWMKKCESLNLDYLQWDNWIILLFIFLFLKTGNDTTARIRTTSLGFPKGEVLYLSTLVVTPLSSQKLSRSSKILMMSSKFFPKLLRSR